MFLVGKKITLRALEAEDLAAVRGFINDPEIENTIVGHGQSQRKIRSNGCFMNYTNPEWTARYII